MHKLSQSLYKSWPVFQALRNLLSICKKLRREKIPSKNRWKPFHQFNVILMAALRCQSIFFRFWSAYIAGTKTQISDIELQKSKWWPRLVFWPANTVTDTWVFPSHCFRFPFLFLPLHCLSQRQRVEVEDRKTKGEQRTRNWTGIKPSINVYCQWNSISLIFLYSVWNTKGSFNNFDCITCCWNVVSK